MNKRKAIPKKVRQSVYLMYNGHCAYCGTEIAYKDMQVDHATPLRIGGADDISNYMPACRSCNHYKATLDVERFRKYLSEMHKRLMRVSDEDIDKMAAVNSNTQLYKQFGNSIVVDVMCAMFKNLNIKQGDNNETLQTN